MKPPGNATPPLIDTHAHLDGFERRGELPAVLARARDAGVAGVIAIGTGLDDWEVHRALAAEHRGMVYYAAGIHPCAVGEGWRPAFETLEAFWADTGRPKPVALGECGLDRFHLPKDPGEAAAVFERQCEAFDAQLALARKLGCPVVVHSRLAFAECIERIAASGVDFARVVFHCFAEGPAEMAELNRRGGRGSFTGILTYKNAQAVRDAAKEQGLSRCMIETDAPYLAPAPHRGKANEPAYVRFTAEAGAKLFGLSLDEFAAKTTGNARTFFGLA